jgi:uncharacterized membrane protein (DUF373 family)
MLKTGKIILRCMIFILIVSLIFASVYLVKDIVQRISALPFFSIDINLVYEIFSMVLVIAVGYELVKSFTIIVSSDKLPTALIVEVAIIALCNKIITLNLKEISFVYLLSIAALMLALGITFFLVKTNKISGDNTD